MKVRDRAGVVRELEGPEPGAGAGPYRVVLADPPWQYRDKAGAGKRGAGFKYDVMGLKDIEALPVNEISADDSVLFMWCTMPMLSEGLNVMAAWGFTYKTVGFTWVKRNKVADSLFWGMGNWTRANAEVCLLGVKGKPKRVMANVHSVVYSPIRKHSQKPNEVRERIVELMGDVSRIELFAREQVEGWDSMGLDIDGKDIRESLSRDARTK